MVAFRCSTVRAALYSGGEGNGAMGETDSSEQETARKCVADMIVDYDVCHCGHKLKPHRCCSISCEGIRQQAMAAHLYEKAVFIVVYTTQTPFQPSPWEHTIGGCDNVI